MSLAVAVSLGQAEVILLDGQSIVKRRNSETFTCKHGRYADETGFAFFRRPDRTDIGVGFGDDQAG